MFVVVLNWLLIVRRIVIDIFAGVIFLHKRLHLEKGSESINAKRNQTSLKTQQVLKIKFNILSDLKFLYLSYILITGLVSVSHSAVFNKKK